MNIAGLTVASFECATGPAGPSEESEDDHTKNSVKTTQQLSVAKKDHGGRPKQKTEPHHPESSLAEAEMAAAQLGTDWFAIHATSANLKTKSRSQDCHDEARHHPDRVNESEHTKDSRVVHDLRVHLLFDLVDGIRG